MNIGGVQSGIFSSQGHVQQPVPASGPQVLGSDRAAAAGGAVEGMRERHRGGGHLGDAVVDTLQSLGLAAGGDAADAQAVDGAAADPAATATAADTSTGAGKAAAPSGNIRHAIHAFMHDLFEAVKSEQSSGSASARANAGNPPSFASGLSALISQVSNGTAPADLQGAFDQLAGTIESAAAGSSASGSLASGSLPSGSIAIGSAGTAGHAAGSVATLQDFLSRFQSELGYGHAAASAAAGSIVSSTA